jgi:hypothetical protein
MNHLAIPRMLTDDQALVVACGAALLAHLCQLSGLSYQPQHPLAGNLSQLCQPMGHSNAILPSDLDHYCELGAALTRLHRYDVAYCLWNDFHGTCSLLGIATDSKLDLEAKLVAVGLARYGTHGFEVSPRIRLCLR